MLEELKMFSKDSGSPPITHTCERRLTDSMAGFQAVSRPPAGCWRDGALRCSWVLPITLGSLKQERNSWSCFCSVAPGGQTWPSSSRSNKEPSLKLGWGTGSQVSVCVCEGRIFWVVLTSSQASLRLQTWF